MVQNMYFCSLCLKPLPDGCTIMFASTNLLQQQSSSSTQQLVKLMIKVLRLMASMCRIQTLPSSPQHSPPIQQVAVEFSFFPFSLCDVGPLCCEQTGAEKSYEFQILRHLTRTSQNYTLGIKQRHLAQSCLYYARYYKQLLGLVAFESCLLSSFLAKSSNLLCFHF